MIGVIYARYSSDSQREESIEGQLRECYAFAEKQGISIFDTYIDRALSAKTDNRPAFQQMIKDSEKQKFNVVIVWKLDRFARNRYDSATYKSKLKKNAVKVISATETISQNAEGILLESMLEGMAEYYSAELAEKVGRGMTENALKCKFNGGTVPIGYTINKDQLFEVDPIKAPYVVEAFKAYANGKTIKEIRDMLNAKGVTTSLGSKISINIVTDMLKNRRYIGEYKFRDIVQKDGIPRIVPQALFDKVQIEREKNKRATARHKAEDDYLLTTKLFCGKCGRYMTGESGTGRSGTVHRYYKCNGAKYKHTCDKKTVKKDWIENLVIKYTREMMMNDNVLEDIAGIVFRNFQKENPVIQLLKQRLSETETALNNLLKAIEEGIITSTTKQRMLELEHTRDEINLKLIKEEMKKPTITKEGLKLWLKQIQAMNLETKEHKQRLIDIFVNAVYLYDDKLVIAFNYKEATKTVTLKEVNGSIIECSGAPKRNSTYLGAVPFWYEQWPRVVAVSQCDAHMAALMTDGSMIHTFDVKKRVAGGTAVGAGGLFACGLLQDHTVQLIEESYGNEKPQSWIDIQKISCGMNHIVGLRSNGTACATGDNDNQQTNLSHWRDLVDIDAGYNITLGITQTGRVEMAGVVDYSSLANDLKGWTDVVQVSAGYDHAIGLRSDGSVLVAGQTDNHRGDAAWWRNMIAVCAGYCCCIGIRDDGTILVAGKIKHGRENIEGRNIFEGLDPAQRENLRQRLIDARNNFFKNG